MNPENKFSLNTKIKKSESLGINELGNFGLSPVAPKRRKLSRRQLKKVDCEIFNNNYKTSCGDGTYESNFGKNAGGKLSGEENVFTYDDSLDVKSEQHSETDDAQEFIEEEYNYNETTKEEKIQDYALPSRSPSPDNLSRSSSQNLHTDDVTGNKDTEEIFTSDSLSKYQNWVLKTYGDQTKTKTVTEKKYQRIVRTLKGEIPFCAENSKFRFWIRSKGFRLGLSPDEKSEELYVSTIKGFKKVAVVEKFLEIIKSVHIGRGRRGNMHAGQKRTYRAITESYSFLPREAVTKYLLGCDECQKRSETDCDAKKNVKKQVDNGKVVTDYSNVRIAPEKKTLRPKNLFVDNHSKIESNYRTKKISFSDELEVNSVNKYYHETGEENSVGISKNNTLKNHLTVTNIIETTDLSRNLGNQDFISQTNSKLNTKGPNGPSVIHTSPPTAHSFHGRPDFSLPHILDPNQIKSTETPKHPMDLCIKRHDKISTDFTNIQNTERNEINETPSTSNFHKRKQSSYLIFRYTTSTPETPTIISIKKDSFSSGSDTTISRSSDFAGESCPDVSPIEKDIKVQNPIMQITTTQRKINIPLNVPNYETYCKKLSENIPFNTNSLQHAVHSDPAAVHPANSTTGTSINVPSLQLLSRSPRHKINEQEVRTTPEPDIEEEKFSSRNGDIQEDLSAGEEVGSIWPGYSGAKKMTPPTTRELSSPLILQETSSIHDETSSSGNKEDEDDDDEDVDDLKTLPHDPERLKAFNMFVRLFVDENLDRIVPISKQPKEKIQAIIDSCTRQFPEFAERARKRIRTYLKSCRRNKRSRDPSTWPETARPTPAHLTSVQAEQILAQACENESHNAKRMRLGLDPVSQPMPIIPGSEPITTRATSMDQFSPAESKLPSTIHNNNNNNNNNNIIKSESPSMVKTEHSISSHSGSPMNGSMTSSSSNLYRPNFTQSFSRGATTHSPYPSTPIFGAPAYGTPNIMGNGPTDLSMKQTKPLLSHRLNPTEMAAVRQLITGYRESAAFLLRSADELEQLLLQQP